MNTKAYIGIITAVAAIGGAAYLANKDISVVYQKQIIINKGGHYTGNYKGTKDSAAIWIWTNDTVWLDNVNIQSDAGGGIRMAGGTKVIISNLKVEGVQVGASYQPGRAIDNYQPAYFKMSSFEISNTGGIIFDHSRAGVQPLIQLYCGLIRNTSRIKGDGTGGKLSAGLQFNTVRNMNPASEAAWIEWNNEPGKSWVEDNFNFYNSSNFKLHDFCIKGAYPYPVTSSSYAGSGVTADGSPDEGGNAKDGATHNLEVHDGTIISTMNAAANIAAGYNVSFHDLYIVSSGMLPDGTKSPRYWSGTCIFNYRRYPDSVFYNNSIKNCTTGYVNNGNENYPYPGRQDENKDRNVNKMPVGGNTFLPQPVTLATEDSAYQAWKARVIAAGVMLGLGDASVAQPAPMPTPPVTPPVSQPVDTTRTVLIPAKRDTIRLHDTTRIYYYITSRYAVVANDTVAIKK